MNQRVLRINRRLLTVGLACCLAVVLLLWQRSSWSQSLPSGSMTLDQFIDERLRSEGIAPAEPADDSEFVRRVFLDIIGVIPTAEQAANFIDDTAADKRARLVDALLLSDEYAEYWSGEWQKLLLGSERPGGRVNAISTRRWLRESFSNNMPYDQFVSELITAEGNTEENPAVNFLLRHELKPLETAARISGLFMGLPLECAQCHDHPYESWTQRDFYGMAAFFAQVTPDRAANQRMMRDMRKKREEGIRRLRPVVTIRESNVGDLTLDYGTGAEIIRPKFLGETRINASDDGIRRRVFAGMLNDPQHPYLSQTIVNRMWAQFLGDGLVKPLDGLIPANPASHPGLLEWMARDFVDSDYDLHHLIRTIANSRTYQRSSTALAGAVPPPELFAVAQIRPLGMEQTMFSLWRATGIDRIQQRRNPAGFERLKTAGLYHFSYMFNDDEGTEEERFQGTVPQALMMMNGGFSTNGSRAAPGTNLGILLNEHRSYKARLDRIFLTTLARRPDKEEYVRFNHLDGLPAAPEIRAGYEDLFWALLNTQEFISNH